MAKHRKYEELLKSQTPDRSWPMDMPAYCYTAACPDPKLRVPPKREAPAEVRSGIRPVKSEKICLICKKRWPAVCGRKYCDCERQGYLYEMSTYYQPRTGGGAVGQGDTGAVH